MEISDSSRYSIHNRGLKAVVAAVSALIMVLSPAVAADEAPVRQIRVLLLDDPVHRDRFLGDMENNVEPIDSLTLWTVSAGEVLPLRVPHANLSPPFPYRGEAELRFYPDAESALAGAGAVATAVLPDGSMEVLLVLLTDDFDGPSFRTVALDNSVTRFPPHSLRVLNQSLAPVRLEYADQQAVEIAIDNATQVTFDPADRYQRISLERYHDDSQRWLPTYSRHLQLRADIRITCLLLPRLQLGEWNNDFVDVYMIREFGRW